tara:strand:+ start:456 stop:875 length:420 start_codon:yes stop_codon:yes gene_type:complete
MASQIEALREEALVYQMDRYEKEHQHPLGPPKTIADSSEKSNSPGVLKANDNSTHNGAKTGKVSDLDTMLKAKRNRNDHMALVPQDSIGMYLVNQNKNSEPAAKDLRKLFKDCSKLRAIKITKAIDDLDFLLVRIQSSL